MGLQFLSMDGNAPCHRTVAAEQLLESEDIELEAQFQISRISLEETKFHYLVSQLEPKYVENIWDIVNSKSDTKYTDSKNRLLSLFKESENLRIKRLLTGIELEDYKACRKFRLFVKGRTTNLHFLVDSGADCSIIPATSKNKQPSDYKLFAAMEQKFPTYGIKVLNIDLGLRREFLFPFIIAKVKFVFPYLDDILVASETEEEHKTHLKLVFDLLQKHGLRVNISKSTLGVTHLEFLGYLITPEGSKPLPEKVDAILSYKLPETIRDLRTFLGLINFYRRYLKDAAKNQAILHEYLKGSRKNDKTKILWTEEAKENFEKCKQDLANATLLSFPDPDLQLALFTDASNFAIGSVLQQFEAGNWKPISFFLKKLTNAQKNYSTYDRELLGIYLFCQKV
ncbi:retrovirus-related Pol polyprotein from transposon opus [Trichonephila clavipes]|nr:retrovirus-related Pol polyprotein from transposon opus [Trichonephila clavipes]